MIELTPAARERFDGYLQRMRLSLRGTRSIEADDVEQSVREHVEVALAGAQQPVPFDQLSAVLERLGPPERWVSDDEKPLWRRVLSRLQFGPDDWRLAYLAFAAFLLALISFPGTGPLFLIPAYLLSRAAVDVMRERGEAVGARKWLIYPSIALVLAFIAGAVLIGPIAGFAAWAVEEHNLERFVRSSPRIAAGVVALAAGGWWIAAAGLIALLLRPLRFIVAPLLDRVERRHMIGLAIVGFVAAGIGAALLWA
jgi:hypothetical protein